MGFLRKTDWDWESHEPEETKEERKEEPKRKIWLWVLAFCCWALSVYLMYQTEHRFYGEVINLNVFGYAVVPLGIGLGYLLREEDEGKKQAALERQRRHPILKWLSYGFVAACFLLIIWWTFRDRSFSVQGMQLFCLLPLLFILDRKEKREDADKANLTAWSLLFSFAILALVSVGAPRVIGLSTVAEEGARLTVAGYRQVTYQEAIEGEWLNIPFERSIPMTEEEEDRKMYLFSGEKQGEHWGIAVDPWTGKILAEEKAEKDSSLELWLEEP